MHVITPEEFPIIPPKIGATYVLIVGGVETLRTGSWIEAKLRFADTCHRDWESEVRLEADGERIKIRHAQPH